MYALNLSSDNRILSACIVLPNGNYDDMPIVDSIPDGNLHDYRLVDGEYVHDPLPVEEVPELPSQEDRITALELAFLEMMGVNTDG